MATPLSDKFQNCIKSLYPGEIITLVEVDGTRFGAQIYRFHTENISYSPEELMQAQASGKPLLPKNIMFNGNEYGPRPFGIQGISFSGDGKPGKPQLSVSNIDAQVGAMVRAYNGMCQAKVTIWILVADLLKEDGTVDPGDYRKLVYFIERPNYADSMLVTFDLTSPYDMDGLMIPARMTQSVCYWAQRGWYKSGKGCTYNGQNGYFDKDGNRVDDPSRDFCSGVVSACKIRFGQEPMDFGGCAAASLIRNRS